MPTFAGNPQQGFTPPPDKDNPVPDVDVHPDSRLAHKNPEAWQGPHPFLAAHGFNGDITSFNNRVQKVHDGFTNTYGREPTPGLVWDLAKSAQLLDDQIPGMFQVPYESRKIKVQQAHTEAAWDGTGIHKREDGKLQPTNLLTAYHAALIHNHEPLPTGPNVLPVKEFQKRFPTIPMGYADFLPFGGKFWNDVYQSHINAPKIKESLGGLSAQDAIKMAQQAGGSQGYQELQVAEETQQPPIPMGNQTPQQAEQGYQRQLATSAKAGLKRDVTMSYTAAIDRNVTRQKWLLAHDENGFFVGLKANGVFDKQWMDAFSKWSRTPSAAYQMLQFQAKQNQFAPDPTGIKQMVEAVKFKQDYVNSRKGLADKWMAQAMPLQFFSHHIYALSLYDALAGDRQRGALANQFEQAVKDWWRYTTNGIPAWQYMMGVGELRSGFQEAKLLYNTLGGAWNQAISYGTAATALLGQLPKVFDGMSTKQLADHVAQSLADNPDMVRLLGFGYLPQKLTGDAKFWDTFGNFALQTVLALVVRGPGFFKFDEATPLEEIQSHPAVWWMTRLAYNNIKVGDLWEAEKIFGTQAAETYLAAVAKPIREGKISSADFHNLSTEFFKNGHVTLPDGSVVDRGTVMPQLRDSHMPKHVTTLKLRAGMQSVMRGANQIEKTALAHGGQFGSAAESFVRSVRGMMELASPEGETVPIYHLSGGQLESFILNSGIMPRDEAVQAVSKFITARGRQNTVGMEKVLGDVIGKFNEKYPLKVGAPPSPFEGLVDTEGRVNVHFPSKEGRRYTNQLLSGMEKGIGAVNDVGRVWRQSILATGAVSLFEKHGVRDTVAALLGGTPIESLGEAATRIDHLVKTDPEVARYLGYTRQDVTNADTVYSQSFKIGDTQPRYNLMEKVHETPGKRNELAAGASDFLRRQVTSDIYPYYLQYKMTGDLTKMTDEVLSNPKLLSQMRKTEKLAEKQALIRENYDVHPHQLTIDGERSMKDALRRAKTQAASEYAKAIAKRFDLIQQEGRTAGVGDLLGEAGKVLQRSPGMSNKKLADFLLKNEVDLTVPAGEPTPVGLYQRTTGKAIYYGMTPNRFWRQKMFDGLTRKYFEAFTKDGYDEKQAALAAIDAAKTQTMFHLLDFSNMLEFERKFRGFLPFFTKHRLFVKWLFTTFAQHPGLALPLQTIQKHLDPYGRLNFHLPGFMGGLAVNINFLRLLFLSSETLPYTFPGAQFIPGLKGLGVASEFTRLDTTFALLFHWGMGGGYDSIVSHLDPYDQSRLNRYMAVYAIKMRMKYGLGAPVSEKAALAYAVARMAPMMAFNNTVSAPSFSKPDLPAQVQALSNEYDKLISTDPKAATEFLNKHPEVGEAWGVSQNWHLYNHNTRLWGLYDQYLGKYMKVEKKYGDMAAAGVPLTVHDYEQMHKASVWLTGRIDYLKRLDAVTWNQVTHNKGLPGVPAASYDPSMQNITQPGPWYTQYSHNLLGSAEDLITLFGRNSFNKKDLHAIYGYDITTWQAELADPNVPGATKALILDKLQRLQGAAKTTQNPTFYSVYTKARDRYETQVIGLYNRAKSQSGYQRALTDWKVRTLILDQYEHPYIRYQGKEVKVLPFSEYSSVAKTPAELSTEIFKNIVGFSYSSMTYDQRQLIGMKTSLQVDEGWGVFNAWIAEYQQKYGKEASTSVRQQLAIDVNKDYAGFWKDYQVAHLPRAMVLLYYAPKAFQGPYAEQWKELVTRAAQTYDTNKNLWAGEVPQLDAWIRANWPPAFVQQYDAVGGQRFLLSLTTAWG